MAKFRRSCKSRKDESSIPKAPFIYLNDPTNDAAFASKLAQLIPKTVQITMDGCADHSVDYLSALKASEHHDTVFIFSHNETDDEERSKKGAASLIRQTAIRLGCNFASINICLDKNTNSTQWGANHLNIQCNGRQEYVSTSEVQSQTEKIYKWLFTVLTVKDTLHLIPDEQMREIDSTTAFPDAEYCPIGECNNIPKDARVQFVALIVTKPVVASENRLTWQVADKTGVANFYFKWRGPSSQHTWDWVLQLEPGQRKCLPRMPSLLLKENILTTIVKAPIRVPGTIIHGTGAAVKLLGSGLVKAGKAMKMGPRKRWVAQADAAEYLRKHQNCKIVTSESKETIKIFTDMGSKTWGDQDSTRSTLEGDSINEKKDID